MTKVKICGITNLKDAQHAIDCGADELGFNFFPGSKRYVSPDQAREIAAKLSGATSKVGVFVNETLVNVLATAKDVGLDKVQLHGDEDQTFIDKFRDRSELSVIKVFRLASSGQVVDASNWSADYFLFDAYSAIERGGTGIKLDWDAVGNEICVWHPRIAYLAGGLTPENVSEAIQKSPLLHAVDVASGVESSPGVKDRAKVEALVKAVRNTDESLSAITFI